MISSVDGRPWRRTHAGTEPEIRRAGAWSSTSTAGARPSPSLAGVPPPPAILVPTPSSSHDPLRIDVRLGLDGGEAAIVVLGSDKTKRHADLIGDVVSLACKIESRADTGAIFLGETVHRNLHFSWRELCSAVDTPP